MNKDPEGIVATKVKKVPLDRVAETESLGPLEIPAPLVLLAPLAPLALVETLLPRWPEDLMRRLVVPRWE